MIEPGNIDELKKAIEASIPCSDGFRAICAFEDCITADTTYKTFAINFSAGDELLAIQWMWRAFLKYRATVGEHAQLFWRRHIEIAKFTDNEVMYCFDEKKQGMPAPTLSTYKLSMRIVIVKNIEVKRHLEDRVS